MIPILEIYDTEFHVVGRIAAAKSVIWRESYYEPGYFEIYCPCTTELAVLLQYDYYVRNLARDDMCPIITKIQIAENEDGDEYITASGYDADVVLNRRTLNGGIYANGFDSPTNINDIEKAWLDRTIFKPTNPRRKIPELCWKRNGDLKTKATATGEWGNLGERHRELLKAYQIGCRITPDWDKGTFTLSLYSGVNRTSNQTANEPVIFSDKLQTCNSYDYYGDREDYANVAYVAGEPKDQDKEEGARELMVVGRARGLQRYELYVDAKDIRQEKHSKAWLNRKLTRKGNEQLQESLMLREISAEASQRYIYKQDYDVGDKVSVETRYGITANMRITEVQETWDENGYTIDPTFDEIGIVLGDGELAVDMSVLADNLTFKSGTITVNNIGSYGHLLFYVDGNATPIPVFRSTVETESNSPDVVLRGSVTYVAASGNIYILAVNCGLESDDTISYVQAGAKQIDSGSGGGSVAAWEKRAITRIIGVY